MDLRGRRPGLKTQGMEVGSEIGVGFGEPGGTRPPNIPGNTPPPPPRRYLPNIFSPAQLTLTVKTDYVVSGTRDVDPHGP